LSLKSGKKKVDSSIKVKASVLDMQLKEVPKLTVQATIESKYDESSKQAGEPPKVDAADIASHEANEVRKADLKIDPLLSTRSEDQVYTFPPEIRSAIKASRDAGNSYDQIRDAVQGYVGFGPGKADLLIKTYQMINRRIDNTLEGLTVSEKALFTQIIAGWGPNISKAISKKLGG
jgi:hypothetical protein